MKAINILDPKVSYSSIDDNNVLSLIEMVRKGINVAIFNTLPIKAPLA